MSEFLKCNSVVSDTAAITDYLIEWRLGSENGPSVFISGEGTDTNIQAQHPFQNEIVLAGTLYPVLQYIWIDGEKYVLEAEEGAKYSPDLLSCLAQPPVVVDPLDCSTVLGSDALYPYHKVYINTSDNGLNKSREISYQISSDTDYLAWLFDGEEVADQIQIFYCTTSNPEGTLIDNIINGTYQTIAPEPVVFLTDDLYPVGYPVTPKVVRRAAYASVYGFRYITNLGAFTYAVGDYLRIKITGAMYQPSINNTNWTLKLKCLSQEDIDDSFYNTNISKISNTPSISFYGDPSCYYEVIYNTTAANPTLSKDTPSNFLWNYLNTTEQYVYNPSGNFSNSNPVEIGLRTTVTASTGPFAYQNYTTCMNLGAETVSLSKTATEFTITCSAIEDYNNLVSNIAHVQASPEYAAWLTTDNTMYQYFSSYIFRYRYGITCGDAYQDVYYYFHLASSIAYDTSTPGSYKVIFTPFIPTIDFSDTDCNSVYTTVASRVSSMSTTMSNAISYPISNIRITDPIYGYKISENINDDTVREVYYYYAIKESFINSIVDFASIGWFYDSVAKEYRLYRHHDKVTFTNPIDHASKLSNWKLERKIFLRTDNYLDQGWETVYETP